MLKKRQVRFPKLIQVLLDLVLLRSSDREQKALLSKIRFPTNKPPVLLEELSEHFTPYSVNCVLQQMQLPTTSYTTIQGMYCHNINIYTLAKRSLSVFDGYMSLLHQLNRALRENRIIRLVEGIDLIKKVWYKILKVS